MKLRSFALKFTAQGGILFPVDQELHKLAIEFADQHLAEKINFTDYEYVTVVAEIDESGKPVKVLAMNCRVVRYDYPVWRSIDADAMNLLIERTRSTLDDLGMKGVDILVHVAKQEAPESRCPDWKLFLSQVGAESASRWRVKV